MRSAVRLMAAFRLGDATGVPSANLPGPKNQRLRLLGADDYLWCTPLLFIIRIHPIQREVTSVPSVVEKP